VRGIIREFRDFAVKGNVVDLAIAVVIGTAFGAIVQSLVKDVIMPPMGYLLGRVEFHELAINLPTNGEPVTIMYGAFISTVINFVIIAFVMFMLVKVMNKLRRKAEAAPAKPTKDQELLAEIRDLLKDRAS
jgi:large conductance mechanosensitive channel